MPRTTTTFRPPLRPKLRSRLARWRARRVPVWTPGAALLVTALVVGICSLLFVVLRTSPLIEWQATLAAVMVVLMTFLTVGLYRGARVHKGEPPAVTFDAVSGGDRTPDGNTWDLPDLGSGFDADDTLVGGIVALLLWVVVGLLLILFLPVLLDLLIGVVLMVVAGLYWIFYRALRQILVRGRRCRGNIGLSMAYAAFFTLLYTGWLFGVLAGGAWIMGAKSPG